jgi:hypothetical protein
MVRREKGVLVSNWRFATPSGGPAQGTFGGLIDVWETVSKTVEVDKTTLKSS